LKQLHKLVLSKQLCHGGHPVLRWNCSNARIDQDAAENIKLNKDKSDEKIDALQALAMAVGIESPHSMAEQFGFGRSIYESQGLLVI
jgi:phage terminase large subunit-like protein